MEGETKEARLKKFEIDNRRVPRLAAISVNFGYSGFHWMDEKKHFLRKYSDKNRKLKIETLKKELKSVFLQRNELENQDESRLSDYENFWRF